MCVSVKRKWKRINTCVFIFSNNPTIFAFVLLCGIHIETFNARKCRDVVIKVFDKHSDAEDAVLVIVGRCGDLVIGGDNTEVIMRLAASRGIVLAISVQRGDYSESVGVFVHSKMLPIICSAIYQVVVDSLLSPRLLRRLLIVVVDGI